MFTHADTNNTPHSNTLTIDLKNFNVTGMNNANSISTTIKLTDSGWDLTALEQSLTDIVENSDLSGDSVYSLIYTLQEKLEEKLEEELEEELEEKVRDFCWESPQLQICNDYNPEKVLDDMDTIFDKFLNRYIFYPPDYKSIGSQADFFKNAISLLKSNKAICESDCTRHNVTMAIRYGTKEEYSEMRDRLSHSDKQCKKDITTELAEQLKDEGLPYRCLKKENKDHIVCKDMLKDINIVQGRVQDLMEMAYSPEEIKITSAQALCIECESINHEDNETRKLIDLLDTLEEQSQCADPKPGKEKKVQSDTWPNSTYTVRKEQDGSFSIPLNLSFSAASDYDGPVPKNQVPAHYMKKVQECMKKANTKMLGPNGEKLQFVIQEPTSPGVCSGIPIEIGSKEHRSNSGKYNSEIHCSSITHEVLHLVGLCDEYKEPWTGFVVDSNTGDIKESSISRNNYKYSIDENSVFKLAYDCRVTSMNNSNIMSYSYLIWEKAFSNTDSSKNLKSLLTPGQFNSILYGKCPEKNNLFNQCSQLAYKSTVRAGKNCLKKKEECETQNGMGADKTTTIDELQNRINEMIEEQKTIAEILEKQSTTKPLGELGGPIGLGGLGGLGGLEELGGPIEPGELTENTAQSVTLRDYQEYSERLTRKLTSLKKKLSIAKSWPDSQ